MAQLRVRVCFDISRYLTDKYFGVVWGPPNRPPKNQFFEQLNSGCQSVMISADILLINILTLLFLRFHNQIFLDNC